MWKQKSNHNIVVATSKQVARICNNVVEIDTCNPCYVAT